LDLVSIHYILFNFLFYIPITRKREESYEKSAFGQALKKRN